MNAQVISCEFAIKVPSVGVAINSAVVFHYDYD